MKRKLKGLMGFLLSLALVMGLMPGMSVKVLAEEWVGNPYTGLIPTDTDTESALKNKVVTVCLADSKGIGGLVQIECYIIKDGICVAIDRINVPIGSK